MRVQTFLGKVSIDALHQMDQQINAWLENHQVQPKLVTQTFGYDRHRDGAGEDPVVITSVWY